MAKTIELHGAHYSDFRYKGKRYHRFLSKDKRDAQIQLGKLMEKIRAGESGGEVTRYPWDKLKERAVDIHGDNERRKKLNGLRRDCVAAGLLEHFFLDEYGKPLEWVNQVTTEVLKKFMAKRAAAGYKRATVKREAGSIKSLMRWAEQCKPRLREPEDWRSVKIPKVGKRCPPHHSREELAHLLKSLPPGRWLTMGWIGGRAGLRRGELLHLRPENIKLESNVVSVVGKPCSMCAECRHNGGFWETKDVDEREIPMPKDLRAYLEKILPALRGRPWIMGDASGHRPALDELTEYFTRLTRKAGLAGGPQKLRATYITHALDDVPSKVVKDWAGHESLSTTEQYVSPGVEDAAWADKMRDVV